MLILDLASGSFIGPDTDHQDNHSEEFLQPMWNPVPTELQLAQPTNTESWKPMPGVISAGLEWLNYN